MNKNYQVMGVLNVTPDSFSDGGKFKNTSDALKQIEVMVSSGADIIDIGGESTRPGAKAISSDEELSRIVPILDAIDSNFGNIKISIDTYKAEVIHEVIKKKIWMINDISALSDTKSIEYLSNKDIKVCLMHMQNKPINMQVMPKYTDIIDEIYNFFISRIKTCVDSGIDRKRICLDPGFGFGKNLRHNLTILSKLGKFKELNLPILVGISRKSMLGDILQKPVEERLFGGIAANVIAYTNGASIIRTHDVAATVDALKVCKEVSLI